MLIDYLPPIVKKIREMREICRVEQPFFDEAEAEIDQVLARSFILLSDEVGLERFEKIFNITPKPTESKEDRRLNILARASKSKVTAELIISILSNYAAGTELIKDYDNFDMKVVLNADAGSLQTIYDILDEKVPLNVYFDFLLKRKTEIAIQIGSKIYTLFDHAMSDTEHCGNENQITLITKTAYELTVGGFCNINPITAAGEIYSGDPGGIPTEEQIFTTQGVSVDVTQQYSANNTPYAISGTEFAGKEA